MKMAKILEDMDFIIMKTIINKGITLTEKIKFPRCQGIEFLYNQPKDDYYTVEVKPGESEVLLTKKIASFTKIKLSRVTGTTMAES